MLEEKNKLDSYNYDYDDKENKTDNYQEDLPSIQLKNRIEQKGLNKSQKISVILLAFFAVLVVFLWSVQFKKSISEPFAYKGSQEKEAESSASNADSEEAMKTKDTDGDGLSDWDELYFYKTSPYLEDSDSDGFSDKEEIDSDNDPNCPEGRDCYSSGIIDGDKKVINEGSEEDNDRLLDNLLNQININDDILEQEQGLSQTQTQELQDVLSGEGDVTVLRNMLLEAGMDEEILSQISDEELIKTYYEILEE